jgi:AbrB family looped-hinge helix DNA binding protein
MSLSTVSSKGQITLPLKIRKAFGINPKDKVRIIIREHEIIIKPFKSFRLLRGSIPYKKGDSRKKVAETVATHVFEISK